MAIQLPVLEMSFIAEDDFSNYQYRFVCLSTTEGYVKLADSTSEQVIGVLQNAPDEGETANVIMLGVTKVVASEALNPNDIVDCQYVSGADTGKAISYVTGGDKLGIVIIAASAENKIASIFLTI